MTRLLSRLAAFAVVAAAAGSPLAATAAVIHFLPGTYDLDDYVSGAPPTAPTDTLVVTVTGGIANFALTGQTPRRSPCPTIRPRPGQTSTTTACSIPIT
jgi:hypothetical protein